MAPVPKTCEFESRVDEESLLLMKDIGPKYCIDSINQTLGGNDDENDEMSTEASSLDAGEDDIDAYFTSVSTSPCSAYLKALERHPLLVKSVTAFILMGLSDAFAQCVEHLSGRSGGAPFNWYRMLRFAIFGLVGAPWTHYYYDWLDTVLPPTPEPWTWTTAVKVFIDQFIQAPALLALIISGLALMEGEGPHTIWEDLRRQYVSTLLANWKLWIPATIVNIAFVKPILRVLFDNVVFFVWTIFLSVTLNAPPSI